MEKFKPQINNNIENKESPEEKHSKWKKEARVLLEGIGFSTGVIVSLSLIERYFGIDLTSNAINLSAVISSMTYMGIRRENLK
ncbi:MAG: hypothetical protein NTU81_03605 [Candidatus Nomurabacteria bacterium]|nr:hypothetical protein [Candidatus Nomurabacteria bacterium]